MSDGAPSFVVLPTSNKGSARGRLVPQYDPVAVFRLLSRVPRGDPNVLVEQNVVPDLALAPFVGRNLA